MTAKGSLAMTAKGSLAMTAKGSLLLSAEPPLEVTRIILLTGVFERADFYSS